MRNFKIISIIFFFILSINLTSYAEDVAYDDEITKLKQKIVELESRIKDLEATLARYQEQEKILDESGYGWQDLRNWRKLKTGMTTEEVLAILGTPQKTVDGIKTLWYYPDIYRGYVSFDDEGLLTGWHEPRNSQKDH